MGFWRRAAVGLCSLLSVFLSLPLSISLVWLHSLYLSNMTIALSYWLPSGTCAISWLLASLSLSLHVC